MNLERFLAELSQRGIKLWLEGDTLRFRAPKGIMTSEDRDLLVLHKAKIISLLSQNNTTTNDTDKTIVPVLEKRDIPLSFPQEQLWFLNQLDPNNVSYNELFALRFLGVLNILALEQSLNKIVARHAALRTNFTTVNGQPVQVIAESLILTVPVVDLSNLPASGKENEVQRLATEQAQKPFDLVSDALIQATVVKLTETEHIFLLRSHHIVWDGWSLGIMWQELAAFYNELSQDLPPLPAQYPDFAVWQRQYLTGEVLDSLQTYWKKQLLDAPPLLELPTDRARGVTQTFRGKHYRFVISKPLTEALIGLSRRQKVTLFMTLLAALQTLLYRYTGQDDLVVGSPIANRARSEFKDLIGYFVNTLVLRTCLAGNPSFEELLSRVRKVTLEAYSHRELPFEKLVEILQPERSLSYTPLFQVMLMLLDELPQIQMEGLRVSPLAVETGMARTDLALFIEKTSSGLIGEWEYNTDLFDDATIARMTGHFQTLLEGIVANPKQLISELSLLTPAEQQQLLVEWNNTKKDYPQDKCIHQLFEEQVERSPNAVAVVFEGEELTYRELNTRANQLAHYLRSLGVGTEVLVGICVERSLEMVIGLLGILKAGGAYVPLDSAYPQERLAFILEDSSASVLLTQPQLVEKLPQPSSRIAYLDFELEQIAFQSQSNPHSLVTPNNLAYVIYTSGSTGKPKGVAIEHHSTAAFLSWTEKSFTSEDITGILASTSICFDLSVFELFVPLCRGGKVILADNALSLPTLAGASEITLINTVPSAIAELVRLKSIPAGVRTINLAGEALPNKLVQKLYEQTNVRQVFNLYGPSEDTTYSTVALVEKGARIVTIGRPISNTQIYLLDSYLQPVPIGVSGELYISGDGLARGYLNRPDLTEERFIPNPFSNEPEERLYKTGDLARYLPDGNIEFLGRIDNQVKVRGFRIELGEIEAALDQHPDVKEVAVICREDTPGNKHLVAYLVSHLIPDRIPYHSECQLELDEQAIQIHTEDISTGGVALIGVPAIEQGKSIRLHLQLPSESFPRWLSGTVVWSHPPQAGVCFHLTPNEQVLIDQCLTYLLENQGLWKTLQRTVTRNLRDYLKQKLPNYMIPSAFVLMKALPLTPNGKVDRRALPALNNFHKELENKFIAPRTPTEAKLAAIWAEVLAVQQVNVEDNFFEVGGHSLLATQIISRIRQTFSIELQVRHVFEFPTIASLSQVIDTASSMQSQGQSSPSMAFDAYPPLVPVKHDTHVPLSFTQEFIWNFQRLYPESFAYNSPVGLRFTGQISPEILEKSINEIIRRHEILRTNFIVVDGQPVQAIAPELILPLEIVDLQNLSPVEREAKAQQLAVLKFQHQFNLESEPLIKITLLQLSAEEYWLLITMHHIITDGWSYGIFFQELQTLYHAFSNGLPSPLSDVALQYADFTIWQRQWLTEDVLQKQLEYWLQKLADIPSSVNFLPMEKVEPSSSLKRASSYSLVLPESQVASIKALSRSRGVTVFTILITVLKILLYKWSGNTDIIVLATTANRQTPNLEKMLGCFINDVFVRSHLDNSQTGIMLLDSVNQTVSEALVNQAIPLQKVVENFGEINPINSLRSISVSMEPPTIRENSILNYKVASIPLEGELWDENHFPLELHIHFQEEHSKSIEIVGLYSAAAFTFETIERLFIDYQEILHKLVDFPKMKIAAVASGSALN